MSDEDEDFEDLFDPNSNIFEMIEQVNKRNSKIYSRFKNLFDLVRYLSSEKVNR